MIWGSGPEAPAMKGKRLVGVGGRLHEHFLGKRAFLQIMSINFLERKLMHKGVSRYINSHIVLGDIYIHISVVVIVYNKSWVEDAFSDCSLDGCLVQFVQVIQLVMAAVQTAASDSSSLKKAAGGLGKAPPMCGRRQPSA